MMHITTLCNKPLTSLADTSQGVIVFVLILYVDHISSKILFLVNNSLHTTKLNYN